MTKKQIVLLCCFVVLIFTVILTVVILIGGSFDTLPGDATDSSFGTDQGSEGQDSSDETHPETELPDDTEPLDSSFVTDSDPDEEFESLPEGSESIPDSGESDSKESDSKESDSREPNSEESVSNPEPLAYETYMGMTAQEQQAYFNSFSSVEDFFAWYNAAKQKYKEENPGVEIGPGGIVP